MSLRSPWTSRKSKQFVAIFIILLSSVLFSFKCTESNNLLFHADKYNFFSFKVQQTKPSIADDHCHSVISILSVASKCFNPTSVTLLSSTENREVIIAAFEIVWPQLGIDIVQQAK